MPKTRPRPRFRRLSVGAWEVLLEGKEITKGTNTIDRTNKTQAFNLMATEGEGKCDPYLGIHDLGEKTR